MTPIFLVVNVQREARFGVREAPVRFGNALLICREECYHRPVNERPAERTQLMPRWPKPPEGSWTEHFDLGTEPMNYEDSISQEFFELEREAVFKWAWLNVGRVEQLPRAGSYFTKELAVAKTSVVVVKGKDGEVRAFYNMCRHRGNKLVWNDYPKEETSGTTRQFVCKYHAWRDDVDGACSFVQQEQEFFDLDKADYGLVQVTCDDWAWFIFLI